jgi:hypothetical protein
MLLLLLGMICTENKAFFLKIRPRDFSKKNGSGRLLENCAIYLSPFYPSDFAHCCDNNPGDEACAVIAEACKMIWKDDCRPCGYTDCSKCVDECDDICKSVHLHWCKARLAAWAIALIVIGAIVVVGVVIAIIVYVVGSNGRSSASYVTTQEAGNMPYAQPMMAPNQPQGYGYDYGNQQGYQAPNYGGGR